MNQILTWLKSRNLSSHAVMAGAVALSGIIMGDEAIRSFILGLFDHHPKIGSGIVLLAGAILKYSPSASQPAISPAPPAQKGN